MKKVSIIALSALLVAALSVPAMAKVNLSGAIWTTYWAQQQGSVERQRSNGTSWVDRDGSEAFTRGLGANAATAPKTFLVGQSMSGNGMQNKATAGYGFQLVADCPVNDWVKAYGDFNVNNGGNLGLVEGYINLAFMKEFNVRAGRMQVPFGHERTTRPTAGQDEVFVSEFSQDAQAALLRRYDVGVQAFGTLASGMVDYNLFVGNGVTSTVADSDGITAPNSVSAAAGAATSNATPDINDAKQVGINLVARPFTGAFIGGSYFAGDYTQPLVTAGNRARTSAYDINAGYEYGNIFSITGEYATTRHQQMTADFPYYVTAAAGTLVENRVNEFIVKAIYTGVADWEFGVRYGAVDPKNVEAEMDAGYSYERKMSFAAGYKFARAAFLKAEYSWIDTDFNFTDRAANVANNVRQSPAVDVNDDIFALSLGLQF